MRLDKLLTIFMMGLFLISFASAFDFDNVKDYDEAKKEITITNAFGLGDDIAKITLNTPQLNYVIPGEDRLVAEFTINNLDGDYSNALKKMEFYDKNRGDSQFTRAFTYKKEVFDKDIIKPIYEEQCEDSKTNASQECTRVQVGSQTIPMYKWIDLTSELTTLSKGNITIGIFTDVLVGDNIEWVPTLFGVEIDEWAVWTDGLNVGLGLYYNLSKSSGDAIESVFGIYDGININSINQSVVGKIGLGAEFNSSQVFNVSDNEGADLDDGNFSVNIWFKWINGTTGVSKTFLSKVNAGGSSGYQTDITTGGIIRLFIWQSDTTIKSVSSPVKINENIWYMFTFVGNGINITTFKNGVFDESTDYDGTIGDNAYDLQIGGSGSENQYFIGVLDELGIWNRSLSATEVTQIYNSGDGISYISSISVSNITLTTPPDAIEQLSHSISFNCSSGSATDLIQNVSLLLDGLYNITTTGNASYLELASTVTNIGLGQHNWTCVSRDQVNFIGETSNRTFTINNFAENSQTFNSTTYETSIEGFIINVSFNSTEFPVSTATLNYNGTGYLGTTSDTGDNKSYSTSLTVPSVVTQQNVSFFWTFILTNTTGNNYFNSSTNNQTINILNASILNTPYNYTFLNFTTYDQDNLTRITSSVASTIQYGISAISQNLSYIDSSDSKFSFEFSFEPPHLDYLAQGNLEFTKVNYITNNYVLLQQTISNATTNISVYLLNTSRSTSFIVHVKDSSFDGVAGAVVESQRYYPSTNTWTTIESLETNIEGKTIGHFVVEDVSYRFLVYVDALLVLTSTPTLVFCESTPCTITLKLPTTSADPYGSVKPLSDYTSSLAYSTTTETFTFSYTDTQDATQGGRLRVVRTDFGVASSVEICNEADGSGTGIITCDISSEINGTYIASGYSNRTTDESRLTERIGIAKIRDIVSELGVDGLIWSAIFFVAIAMLFLFSPAMAIVASIFSLIAISLMGLISIPLVSITALISIGVILLWVISR